MSRWNVWSQHKQVRRKRQNSADPFSFIRYATQEMLCMHCKKIQPVAQFCNSEECAGRKLSHYYCDYCKFHDNDSAKHIYHCPDCKICRIGKGLGVDRFHCKTCDTCLVRTSLLYFCYWIVSNLKYILPPLCITQSLHAMEHKCIPDSMKSNCPICGQYLFSSRDPLTVMNCGHPIHRMYTLLYLKIHTRTQNRKLLCAIS